MEHADIIDEPAGLLVMSWDWVENHRYIVLFCDQKSQLVQEFVPQLVRHDPQMKPNNGYVADCDAH